MKVEQSERDEDLLMQAPASILKIQSERDYDNEPDLDSKGRPRKQLGGSGPLTALFKTDLNGPDGLNKMPTQLAAGAFGALFKKRMAALN